MTNKQLKALLIGARSLLESIDRHLGTGGDIVDGSVHHGLIKRTIESIEANARLPKGENTTGANDPNHAVYGTSQLSETIVDDIAKLNMSDATFHEKARHVKGLLAGHIKTDTNIEDADLQEAIELLKNANNSSSFFKSAKEFTEKYSPKPKFGPFSLEKYTPESIVKTVDGRDVRILCTDRNDEWCIVGLVSDNGKDLIEVWNKTGLWQGYPSMDSNNFDLMIQEQDSGREIAIDLNLEPDGHYWATVVVDAYPVSTETQRIKRIKTRI